MALMTDHNTGAGDRQQQGFWRGGNAEGVGEIPGF